MRSCIRKFLLHLAVTYADIKNRLEASKDYAKVWEGVKSIMVGKVLDYEAKRIKNEGFQEGYKDGLRIAKLELTLEFVRDGIITLSEAANRLSMTEDELKAYIK